MATTNKLMLVSGGRPNRAQNPAASDINESVILTLPEDVLQDFEKRYTTRRKNSILEHMRHLLGRARKSRKKSD
jgi:hypothetical protein